MNLLSIPYLGVMFNFILLQVEMNDSLCLSIYFISRKLRLLQEKSPSNISPTYLYLTHHHSNLRRIVLAKLTTFYLFQCSNGLFLYH